MRRVNVTVLILYVWNDRSEGFGNCEEWAHEKPKNLRKGAHFQKKSAHFSTQCQFLTPQIAAVLRVKLRE